MILIEFQKELNYGFNNIVKYREVDDDNWYYLYIDIETLNLLVKNYGIISTNKFPTKSSCLDNLTTGKEIKIKYCGTDIELYCGNNLIRFNLDILGFNF